MFLCYCVAWYYDLDLWPFDLETVSCTVLLMSDPHTNFYYSTTIGYWVTSTEYLITLPLSEIHCACAVSRDLCIGGPPKSHVTIFDPELSIHYTTFTGLLWRLRVVYIGASPCQSDFRSQKVQSKSAPIMAVFRKFKGLNMKYSYRDPQKAHTWSERRPLAYSSLKSGCRL